MVEDLLNLSNFTNNYLHLVNENNSNVNNKCDLIYQNCDELSGGAPIETTAAAAAATAATTTTVATDSHNNSCSDSGTEKYSCINKSDCDNNGDKYYLRNNNFLILNKMNLKYFILIILIILLNLLDYTYAHQKLSHGGANTKNDNRIYHHSSDDFSKHTIIRPKLQHGRHKRPMENTLEESGLHVNYLTLKYEYNNKDVIIDLQLNYQLIPEGHFLSYQTPDGKKVVRNLTKTETDFCHYHGTIRGAKDSRVALSTCKGINGIVFDGEYTYHIQSGPDKKIHSDHFLYDHADLVYNATCGYVGGINRDFDPDLSKESEFNRVLRYKRAASSSEDGLVRGPYNSNKDSAYVELVIVIDNQVYKSKGENLREVYSYAKDLVNIMNSLYVPLNIFIALVGVVVWTENNEVELSNDGDKTLKNFLHYRKSKLIKDHPNDNAQLLTNEKFDGGVVGKALKGPICTIEYSGGVSMDHSTVISVVATTMAHELGHNFGMEHDLDDCKCVDDRCIMAASSSSVSPKHWSSCSIDQLNLAFHHGMNHCLKNKPKKMFDTQTCGNGFVEPGEQCDCGVPEVCNNSCCDPNTCMLHANASCATGECCDFTTCRPRVPGYECRAADGECDLPEYCTGESEYCPNDVFKRDTESCGNGKAYCYRGSCRSHTDQCKVLWGPSGKSSDQCYDKNRNGSVYGNCGHNKLTNTFTSCKAEDIYCGLLHCRHLNEKLEFGMETIAVLSHTYINYKGNIIPCRTAVVDLGLESRDPGLTPDGAKCGDDKMCVNQKCTSIENLQAAGKGVACPEDCNGHGICNSEGHCHCFLGFGGSTCKDPGAGGSIDSGPASNIQENSHIVRIMTIFFLGVVPTMSLIAFAIFYWRQNRLLPGGIGRKASNVLISTTKSVHPRHTQLSPNQPTSTPSSPDDMNSALLKNSNDDALITNNTMFGKFKGFTLKPLPKDSPSQNVGVNVAFVTPVAKITEDSNNVAPNRSAPPVPKHITNSNHTATLPSAAKMVQNKSVGRANTTASSTISRPNLINPTSPALPPLNPGSNPRPIISSPILETSTCTAKELLSPLRNNAAKYPVRAAPVVPPVEVAQPIPTISIENEKEKRSKDSGGGGGGTLQRIASFLKKDDKKEEKKSNSLKRNASIKRAISIDKEKLKNIEISAPIPQPTPEVPQTEETDTNENRISVNRTQSMRDTQTQKKPVVQTFGSMRQPATNRPKSIVGSRPKSPPPPRPPVAPIAADMKIPGVPGYQNPPAPKKVFNINDYDDCEAVEAPLAHISEENSPTGDNIYAVIDESPPKVPPMHPPVNKNIILPAGRGGSIESVNMSLLGEIVNEIENRNLDSIYSASTLKKKKKDPNDKTDPSYANTSDNQEESDNEYSNMNIKSNSSTTSSGYLRPSAINTHTPIARVAPSKPELPPNVEKPNTNYITPVNNFSSFKTVDNKTPNTNNASAYSRNLINNNNRIQNNKKEPTTTNSTAKGTTNSSSNKSNHLPSTFKSSPQENTPSKPLMLSRTVTPPNLKSNTSSFRTPTQKSTPTAATKPTISSPKVLNPDLVSSTIKSKPPDILATNNNNSVEHQSPNVATTTNTTAKPKTLQKPKSVPIINNNNINNTTTTTTKSNQPNAGDKLVNNKTTAKLQHQNSSLGGGPNDISIKNKIIQNGSVTPPTTQIVTAGINSRNGSKPSSTVASLQQKFEGGNNNRKLTTSAASVKK